MIRIRSPVLGGVDRLLDVAVAALAHELRQALAVAAGDRAATLPRLLDERARVALADDALRSRVAHLRAAALGRVDEVRPPLGVSRGDRGGKGQRDQRAEEGIGGAHRRGKLALLVQTYKLEPSGPQR